MWVGGEKVQRGVEVEDPTSVSVSEPWTKCESGTPRLVLGAIWFLVSCLGGSPSLSAQFESKSLGVLHQVFGAFCRLAGSQTFPVVDPEGSLSLSLQDHLALRYVKRTTLTPPATDRSLSMDPSPGPG